MTTSKTKETISGKTDAGHTEEPQGTDATSSKEKPTSKTGNETVSGKTDAG